MCIYLCHPHCPTTVLASDGPAGRLRRSLLLHGDMLARGVRAGFTSGYNPAMVRISRLPFVLMVFVVAARALAEGPVYRLDVGDAHTFDSTVEFKVGVRRIERAEKYTTWVIAANPDGIRRVILKKGSAVKLPDGTMGKASVDVGFADLSPDGRIKPETQYGHSLYAVFPMLPPTINATQWTGPGRTKDGETTYTTSDTDPSDGLTFSLSATGPLYSMQATTYDGTATFDSTKGLVTKVDCRYAQGFGAGVNATMTIVHVSSEKLSAEELAQLQKDAETAHAALRKQSTLLDEAKHNDPTKAASTIAEAEQVLKSAQVEHQTLKQYMDAISAAFPAQASLANEIAQSRAAMIGNPAPEWELEDLNGKQHKLADYRGKTVVLEFWNRGCTICMASMPTLKRVVESYAGQPVEFIGMNTDADPANAKFVVENMGLTHTNLKAARVTDEYKLVFFPSLYVIDPEGIVREVHVGGSDALEQDIRQAVAKASPSATH